MTTKEIGAFGEDAACEYLEDNDYEISERNFSLKTGEIDIIAEKDGCTVFVEVKTRKSNLYGEPSEAVNWKKREHIRRTALLYLNSLDTEMRFDVIEVFYNCGRNGLEVSKINHIRNAF